MFQDGSNNNYMKKMLSRDVSQESFATFTRLGVKMEFGGVFAGHGAIRCHNTAIGVFFADGDECCRVAQYVN